MNYKQLLSLLIFFSSTVYAQEDEAALEALLAEEEPIVTIAQEPALEISKELQKKGIPLRIPFLGTLQLKPFTKKDPETNRITTGLRAYFPAPDKTGISKKWELGPLTLNEGQFTLIEGKLGYSAQATFMGKEATVSLKSISSLEQDSQGMRSLSGAVLGIELSQELSFEIIPGNKATTIGLNSLDLIFSKDAPRFVAHTILFGQPVLISFFTSKEGTELIITIKKPLYLKEIISGVENSSLKDAFFNKLALTIQNMPNDITKTKKLIVNLYGELNLEFADELGAGRPQKAMVDGTISANRLAFKAKLPAFRMPAVGNIRNALLVADISKKEKKIILEGDATVNLSGVGTFDVILKTELGTAEAKLTGSLKQKVISVAGIDIHDISVSIFTKERAEEQVEEREQKLRPTKPAISLSLQGDAVIFDYKSRVIIEKATDGTVAIEAEILDKEIKPFAGFDIPQVSQIVIKDPHIRFDKSAEGYELITSGIITLFGMTLKCEMYSVTEKDGTPSILVGARAEPGWKLSQAYSELKFLDNIQLNQLSFIICTKSLSVLASKLRFLAEDLSPQELDETITFGKGFNIIARADLKGPLAPVGSLIKAEDKSLLLFGHIETQNPLNSIFRISIPTGMKLASNIKTGRMILEIVGKPDPHFFLLLNLLVQPTPKDQWLTFTSRIGFGVKGATLAGTMQGTWQNVAGINNFNLGNVALQIGLTPVGIPVGLGIAGSLAIEQRSLAMAMNIDMRNPQEFIIAGSIDRLEMNDIIALCNLLLREGKLSTTALPTVDMYIKNFDLYVAPQRTQIGEIQYEQGIHLEGMLFAFGFTAAIEGKLSELGISLHAFCSPINWGPLKLTRSHKDITGKQAGTLKLEEAEAELKRFTDKANRLVKEQEQAAKRYVKTSTAANLKALEGKNIEVRKAQQATSLAQEKMRLAFAGLNGPELNFELSLLRQEFRLSGTLSLANIFEQDTYVLISTDAGITFRLKTILGKGLAPQEPPSGKPTAKKQASNKQKKSAIQELEEEETPTAGLLEALIIGKSSGSLTSPQFELVIDFTQRLMEFVEKEVEKGVDDAIKTVRRDIQKALKDIEKLDEASKEADKRITDAQQEVERAKSALAAINAEMKKIEDAIKGPREDVKKLETDIEATEKAIDEKKRWFDNLPWYEQSYQWAQLGIELTGLGTKLAGLKVAKEVADGILLAAQETGKGPLIAARKSAELALKAAQEFLDKVGRPISKGTIEAAKKSAEEIVKAGQTSAIGFLETGEKATKLLRQAIDIKHIRYQGNLQDIVGGVLGNVTFNAILFGQTVNIKSDISIADPVNTIKTAINKIISEAKDFINKLDIVRKTSKLLEIENTVEQVQQIEMPADLKERIDALDAKIKKAQGTSIQLKKLQAQKTKLTAEAKRRIEFRMKQEQDTVNKKIDMAKQQRNAQVAKAMADAGKIPPAPSAEAKKVMSELKKSSAELVKVAKGRT